MYKTIDFHMQQLKKGTTQYANSNIGEVVTRGRFSQKSNGCVFSLAVVLSVKLS